MNAIAVAAQTEHAGVRVVTGLHPGVSSTELARDHAAPIRPIATSFFTSPEQGTRTSLPLAAPPEAAQISGRHFADADEKAPGALALDDALAERLWTSTERLVALARTQGVTR